MLTNGPKRENNGVTSINKNMTNLAIAATTFDIDFKLAYVDVGSSRVHDLSKVIQLFLNYVVIHVPDRRLT